MRKNKKGFTLVELVIVIAVIAILAAVLLPTFTRIIENAKVNSATQKATGALKDYYSAVAKPNTDIETIDNLANYVIVVENGTGTDDYKFTVGTNGTLLDYEPSTDKIAFDSSTKTLDGYTLVDDLGDYSCYLFKAN